MPETDNTTEFAGLGPARVLAHHAVQFVSRAARANLEPLADDSHSNLGWSVAHEALLGHPLKAGGLQLGFQFAAGNLVAVRDTQIVARLALAGNDDAGITDWVDGLLADAGLKPLRDGRMPYALDSAAAWATAGQLGRELRALGAWFGQAARVLAVVANTFTDSRPGPSPIRCWPHHFDIGTLIGLAPGDPETAPSIGLGLSPGDGYYDEPYYYCSPYPPPATDALPSAPSPLHWHTDGLVSLILPAGRIAGHLDEDATASALIAAAKTARQLALTAD